MSSVYRRKLSIGVQTFSDTHKGVYYYVDKTPFERLSKQNKYYFLLRPSQFDMSLMLDNLRYLF